MPAIGSRGRSALASPSVTVSGATHMSESRILAIAGIDASRSLPFFDVAQAKAKLEADPLVKQASVRKLYPNQVVIEHRRAHALRRLAKGRRRQRNRRRRSADRRGRRRPLRRPALCGRRRRERARARICRAPGRDGRIEAARRGRRPRRPAALESSAEVRRSTSSCPKTIPKARSPSFSPFNASPGFWKRTRWRSTSAFQAGCSCG